ncbi:MAG: hypothetical protein DRJ03_16985 [Chloroflexi bacterium]|nr:MAG: hypothetical protein DRJ03_16985 [Chloroflexota bacterium]
MKCRDLKERARFRARIDAEHFPGEVFSFEIESFIEEELPLWEPYRISMSILEQDYEYWHPRACTFEDIKQEYLDTFIDELWFRGKVLEV